MTYMFKVIRYCLQIYLKILKINVLKYINLILMIFLFEAGLAWQACLEKAGVKLQLLTNNDMFMMAEKGVRGEMQLSCNICVCKSKL